MHTVKALYEAYQQIILNEYSESFIKQQIDRLKKTAGAHVTDDTLRFYITRFDQIKTSKTAELKELIKSRIENKDPIFTAPAMVREHPQFGKIRKQFEQLQSNPLQLEFYNWKQLEAIVDAFPPPESKEAKQAAKSDKPPAEIVYNKDGILIFYGVDRQACQMFQSWARTKNLPKIQKAQQENFKPPERAHASDYPMHWYNFCIGWPGTGNLFDSYRFGRGGSDASIYYVYDNNKPITDKYHLIVVQARENGMFLVTDAFNSGDTTMSWEQLLKIQPKLAGAKDVLVFKPFSEKEQEYLATRDATPSDFSNFTNYNVQRAYIVTPERSGRPKKIYKKDYLKIDPRLQHEYINARSPAADVDPSETLDRLIKPFADSTYEEVVARNAKARQARAQGDPNWKDILGEDPTVAQSKQKQIYYYYNKLIKDYFEKVGKQAKK